MKPVYLLILAGLLLIATGNLALLGLDWITQGYGLHPFLAWPLAVITAIGALASGVEAADRM